MHARVTKLEAVISTLATIATSTLSAGVTYYLAKHAG